MEWITEKHPFNEFTSKKKFKKYYKCIRQENQRLCEVIGFFIRHKTTHFDFLCCFRINYKRGFLNTIQTNAEVQSLHFASKSNYLVLSQRRFSEGRSCIETLKLKTKIQIESVNQIQYIGPTWIMICFCS